MYCQYGVQCTVHAWVEKFNQNEWSFLCVFFLLPFCYCCCYKSAICARIIQHLYGSDGDLMMVPCVWERLSMCCIYFFPLLVSNLLMLYSLFFFAFLGNVVQALSVEGPINNSKIIIFYGKLKTLVKINTTFSFILIFDLISHSWFFRVKFLK